MIQNASLIPKNGHYIGKSHYFFENLCLYCFNLEYNINNSHITVKEFLRDSDFSKEKFPTVALTLNAARHPNYYFCNTFLLVFLITISGLSTFSIRVDLQQHRIQTTCKSIIFCVKSPYQFLNEYIF